MELPGLPSLDPAGFALRVAWRSDAGAWSLLVVPRDEVVATAAEIVREVEAIEGRAPVAVAARGGALDFVADLMRHRTATVVASGIDSFTPEDWRNIDLGRSRLLREGEVVVVLGSDAAADLLRYAPHLASWVSGYAWTSSAAALRTEHERRKSDRLADLRAWARGVTDEEILRLAAEGRLPNEPEYAEWLVLLGRGDLLGSR